MDVDILGMLGGLVKYPWRKRGAISMRRAHADTHRGVGRRIGAGLVAGLVAVSLGLGAVVHAAPPGGDGGTGGGGGNGGGDRGGGGENIVQMVRIDPNHAQSGQAIRITFDAPVGVALTTAAFTFTPFTQYDLPPATFDAQLVLSGQNGDGQAVWTTQGAVAPTEQQDVRGFVSATVTTSDGLTLPAVASQSFDDIGYPTNQLPEAPYAAIFPATLLMVFGVYRLRLRRRRA
jgi:hypothetical protein